MAPNKPGQAVWSFPAIIDLLSLVNHLRSITGLEKSCIHD
jgi:hypothetical protein